MIENNIQPSFKGLFKIQDRRVLQAEQNFSRNLYNKLGQICYDEYVSRVDMADGAFLISDKSRDANIFSKLLKEGINFLYKNIDIDEINLHNVEKLNDYFPKIKKEQNKITFKLPTAQKYWLN